MKDADKPDPGEELDVVLVVDLDGTLCRTDTLHEAVLGLVGRAPRRLPRLAASLFGGRAAFKSEIAKAQVIPGDDLPLNEDVLSALRSARAAGRKTALVTASHQKQAEAVAAAIELFDEVHGSDDACNLKGQAKAAFLTDRFGEKGFDYMGDARSDLPVWAVARRAITVGAGPEVRRATEAVNPQAVHLSPPESKRHAMQRALRPHQWSKNVLLFLPLLAAHDPGPLGAVILGFFAFCLTASAVYILNDLVDLPSDRAHPRKCRRPFASGELSAAEGVAMATALFLGAVFFGAATGRPAFLGSLMLYLATTFAYSIWLKRKLIIDVLTLAGLYTVRIIAGGAAAGIVLSPWLLGFSMFLFLSLAAVKRQAELTDQLETRRESSGRAYLVEDLPILRGVALSAAHAAVLVMALYISSDAVQLIYGRPELLWLICPLLLYWLIRMVMMTHRGHMTDDPIVFAIRDRISLLVVLATVLVLGAAALI